MQTLAAYYDGRISQKREVRLSWDETGRIRIEVPTGIREYPLAEVRISARLGNTPRSLYFPDGAKCEIADNELVDALVARHAPRRLEDLIHHLESRLRYALIALVLTAVAVWGLITLGIPALAERVAYALPQSIDFRLAKEALVALDSTLFAPSELDSTVQKRLREKFLAMTRELEQGYEFRLEFRKSEIIGANAFALPAGIIVMTDELVGLAQRDEELIAVLAHELGHVVRRHALRQVLQDSAVTLGMAAVIGDATSISTLIMVLPTALAELKYSRALETEADDYALAFLIKYGVSPTHLAKMLARMQQSSGGEEEGPGYLSTHPSTRERINRFNRAAQGLPVTTKS
jgi:predicted Zn-dependent protease